MRASQYLRLLIGTAVLCLMTVSAQGEPLDSRASAEPVWSQTLQQWRRVIIRLPDSYQDSTQAYPVVYLLDGDAHYAHASDAAAFLAENNMMPEVIVVAITNGIMTRDRNLTPVSTVAKENHLGGGADDFLKFIADELMPWVNQRYRTEKFNILIGHSYGGLFALHTLRTRPEVFQAYIALDPSLWYSNQQLVTEVPAALRKLDGSHFRYLYTAGTPENEPLKAFTANLRKSPPSGITLRSRPTYAGDTHNNMVHLAIYDGLKQLFEGWSFEPVQDAAVKAGREPFPDVKAHFEALSAKYGFPTPISEKAYLWASYQILPDEEQPTKKSDAQHAVAIMEEMATVYPPRRYLSLPVALDKAGRSQEALQLLEAGLRYFSVRPNRGNEMLDLYNKIEQIRPHTLAATPAK